MEVQTAKQITGLTPSHNRDKGSIRSIRTIRHPSLRCRIGHIWLHNDSHDLGDAHKRQCGTTGSRHILANIRGHTGSHICGRVPATAFMGRTRGRQGQGRFLNLNGQQANEEYDMALSAELRKILEATLDENQIAALDKDPAVRSSSSRPASRPRPWTPLPADKVNEVRVAGFKQCNCCGRILACGTSEHPADYGDYGRDNAMKDGRKGSCRICCTQQSRESTARTRGKAFECTSQDPAVFAVFPKFDAEPEKAAAWAVAHPEPDGTTAPADRPSRQRSGGTAQSQAPVDTSALIEETESGVITV